MAKLSEMPEKVQICGIVNNDGNWTQVMGVTEKRGDEIILIAGGITYCDQKMEIEI